VTGAPRADGNWQGPILVAASVVLAAITVLVSTQPKPNAFAASLLQAITLVFGTYGAFILGKVATRSAAQEIIRPHARSAFRRVQNLYAALGRQRAAVANEIVRLDGLRLETNTQYIEFEHARASLAALEYMVIEQISTADDALEDWRDLVPEEVAEIEAEAARRTEGNA
jgi:hypothetical protein